MQLPGTVSDFLSQKRIAVIGVSRNPGEAANLIYRKLREQGYQVFPVNPRAQEVEGDRCYPDVESLPGSIAGAVVLTPPGEAASVVRSCAEKGVSRVWLHRSLGSGSVSEEAVRVGKELGITVIAGGCPMMFLKPVDFGHRCMRWLLGWHRRLR